MANGLVDYGIIKPGLSFDVVQQGEERKNRLMQQQQANELAKLQLQSGRRAEEEAMLERDVYRNTPTQQDLPSALFKAGLGKQGLAVGKSLTEQQKAKVDQLKTTGEILSGRASRIMVNPTLENAINQVAAFGRDTGGDVSTEIETLRQMGNDPKKIFEWSKGYAMKGHELVTSSETSRHNRATEGLTSRGQELTYGAATQPVFSEASGGFYTRPTGGRPSEFIPASGTDMTIKGKSVAQAKQNVTTLASEMAQGYKDLLNKKGIKSTEEGAASNLSASSQSSMVGQMLGSAFGTEEQDIRDYVKSQRPLLVQAMVKATGMSAQQINSNAELKNMLDAATDPSRGYESNIRALNGLNNMFGTGTPILPGAPAGTPPPAPASNINVPGVGLQLKVPGSAAPAARPSLDSIFGTNKK